MEVHEKRLSLILFSGGQERLPTSDCHVNKSTAECAASSGFCRVRLKGLIGHRSHK